MHPGHLHGLGARNTGTPPAEWLTVKSGLNRDWGVLVGICAIACVNRQIEGLRPVRTLNHLTDTTEALRELHEGLAGGMTRANIAAHLGVTEQELERIESAFGGMNSSQIAHVLRIEGEVEELRREIEELRRTEIGSERWRGL